MITHGKTLRSAALLGSRFGIWQIAFPSFFCRALIIKGLSDDHIAVIQLPSEFLGLLQNMDLILEP